VEGEGEGEGVRMRGNWDEWLSGGAEREELAQRGPLEPCVHEVVTPQTSCLTTTME